MNVNQNAAFEKRYDKWRKTLPASFPPGPERFEWLWGEDVIGSPSWTIFHVLADGSIAYMASSIETVPDIGHEIMWYCDTHGVDEKIYEQTLLRNHAQYENRPPQAN